MLADVIAARQHSLSTYHSFTVPDLVLMLRLASFFIKERLSSSLLKISLTAEREEYAIDSFFRRIAVPFFCYCLGLDPSSGCFFRLQQKPPSSDSDCCSVQQFTLMHYAGQEKK
jgi:hypothetical protein